MNWYPGMETAGGYYPPVGNQSGIRSDNSPSQPNNAGFAGVSTQGMSTVFWGLGLLAVAFILMHLTDRME